jgi:hypothetical protein
MILLLLSDLEFLGRISSAVAQDRLIGRTRRWRTTLI